MLNIAVYKDVLAFVIGFSISTLIMSKITSNNLLINYHNTVEKVKNLGDHKSINPKFNSIDLYDHKLADKLFNEVRILCMVFTFPANHKTKLPHVKNTWGKRCNKLLFISSQKDPQHPEIVALNMTEGRQNLWLKTRTAMKYVYENHLNDADWFLRADDDNYLAIENLRYKLYQYNPKTSLYIGHRYALKNNDVPDYMAGGGNIFSKKALKKFVIIAKNETLCNIRPGEPEDVMTGRCMKNFAIFLDAHDSSNQKQMFPLGVEQHMRPHIEDYSFWYWPRLYRNVTQGSIKCCSDIYIEAHYVGPKEMYMLDYLIYKVHPFGLRNNVTEILPRKLSLEEIIKESDKKSVAPDFVPHKNIHYIDDDEKYK